MTVAATTGTEKVTLTALVQTGMRFKPIRVQDLIIAELRRQGDFRLERHRDELLGAFAGDNDNLALVVGGHVHIGPTKGEARVGHFERLPLSGHAERTQLVHLHLVELDGVGTELFRFFLRRFSALGHVSTECHKNYADDTQNFRPKKCCQSYRSER